MTKRILVVEDQPDNRQIIRDMLAPTDYEITEGRRRKSAGGNRKGAARSHFDGHPIANHGRLCGHAPNQGRSCIAINPDNCGYVLCAQWRRTEGADGRLR
jgi:hypothetical protein